ncbi:MAG: carbohydrate-binding domain-containing protein, partial [Kiritimatiellae bacterium]|nr:carbohydrate-binding domain-containing protein [Kiritimatiellia bacterium]
MKLRTMKVLTPLAAFALTLGLEAGTSLTTEGFEGYTAGSGITSGQNNFLFVPPAGEAVADQSKVTAYADDAMKGAEVGSNYLKLSTEDGKLFRSINALNDGALGDAVTPHAEGVDIDAVMQFTATDSSDRPEAGDEKFVMWLESDTSGETPGYSLMVLGGKYASEGLSLAGNAIYKLSGVDVAPGSWHRVTVKAFPNVNGEGTNIPGFQVFIDGEAMTAERVLRQDESGSYIFVEEGVDPSIIDSGLADGVYIPSMSSEASLKAVGFAGEGKIDNLAVTDNYVAPTVTFGITVPDGVEIVSVTDTASSTVIEPEEGKYTTDPGAALSVVVGLPAGKLFDDGSKTKTLSLTAAADTVASGIDAESIKDAAAKIGEDEFLDIGAAYNAAVAAKGGTITLLQNIESGVLKWDSSKFTSDFIVDLGGKTITFDCADSKYAIQITKGTSTVTFKNGQIAAKASAEGKPLTTVFQNYANLVVEDVAIDADNFNGTTNPYTDKPGMIFAVMNGSLAITGSTSVANCHGWVLSVGNHAGTDYVSRAVTLDTTGTLDGDFRFCGGTVTYVKCGFADDAKFYYGAACAKIVEGNPVGSTYADGDLIGFPFVARAGGEPVMPTVAATYSYAGQFYQTADAAFAAASAGDIVTIIADVADVDVEINKTLTLDATGYTVVGKKGVYAIRVMDGDLTIVGGTFKTEDATSNSLFLIGDWEGKTEDQYKGGTLTINGGTFGGVKVGNLIKNSRGSVVVNGGSFTSTNSRGIKADGPDATVVINTGAEIDLEGKKALCADQGGKITVNGGEVTGNVVIEGSSDDSAITINGGKIAGSITKASGTILIPGTSTALFNADQSAFCASGYATVADSENVGWFKVAEASSSDIEVAPGATTTDPFDTEEAATAAMAKVVIVPAEAVTTGLEAADLEAYKGKFEKKVVAVDDKFAVAVVLSSAAETELQTQANNDAKVLDPAAAAAAEVEAEAEIATIPGFYYSLKTGATLNGMVEGDRTLATKGTLKLKVPNKGASGFYQVLINIGP